MLDINFLFLSKSIGRRMTIEEYLNNAEGPDKKNRKAKAKASTAVVGAVARPKGYEPVENNGRKIDVYDRQYAHPEEFDKTFGMESLAELQARQARNQKIADYLKLSGLDAGVIASHNFGPEEGRGGLQSIMVSKDGQPYTWAELPDAYDAAIQQTGKGTIVGAFCGHGEYKNPECLKRLQTVADTSRGGEGATIIFPMGRNVDTSDKLGKIYEGLVRIRPKQPPQFVSFRDKQDYLQTIKDLK